jgi:hypothetical protein
MPLLVAVLSPRTLPRRNHGLSETPSARGLLTPTFVMLSDMRCPNNGFCLALCCIKPKRSHVLKGLYHQRPLNPTTHRKQEEPTKPSKKPPKSENTWRVDKHTCKHHVVRLSRDSHHRRSIRCFASSIWCLPSIRHHRSV